MLRTYEASKDLSIVLAEPFELVIPRSDNRKGFFTLSNSDLKLTTMDFCVLSYRIANLTIPPYFINTDFVVMNGLILNDEVMEEYGGKCTEVFTLKFTGRSKDSLSRYLGKIFKAAIAQSLSTGSAIDASEVLPLYIRFTFEKNTNQDGKPYFSVLCQEIKDLPELFKSFDAYELMDIIGQMPHQKSLPDSDD